MAKHHSSFERAMVLIFLVIGISAWGLSQIDLPQEELVGLAGGGFFEVFDRDLAGMAFGSAGEALDYLNQKENEIESYSIAALKAQENAARYQTIAAGFSEGDPSRQLNLALAEAQVLLTEQYTSMAAAIVGEITSEQDNILIEGIPPNVYSQYTTRISGHYATSLTASTASRSIYSAAVISLTPSGPSEPADADEDEPATPVVVPPATPPEPDIPDVLPTGIEDLSTLGSVPVMVAVPVVTPTLNPGASYEGYALEATRPDGSTYTDLYVLEPSTATSYNIKRITVEGGFVVKYDFASDVAGADIASIISDDVASDGWYVIPDSATLTPMTISGDFTGYTEAGAPVEIFTAGTEASDVTSLVGASLSSDFGITRTAVATTIDPTGLSSTAVTPPTTATMDLDDGGFQFAKTEEGIAEIGAILEGTTERSMGSRTFSRLSGSWDSTNRVFTYKTNEGISTPNYKMDYYVDDYGHLYRVIGDSTSADAQIQLVSRDTDIYDHEVELMNRINEAMNHEDGLDYLALPSYDGVYAMGIGGENVQAYLDRQDKQATFMADGTTIKRSDVDKIYASVLALTQEIQGLSTADVISLRNAGMDDTAIKQAYEQIPEQYRGGAAGELSKEVRAINNHLKETGKPDWTYNGGVAYSGTYGGTSVGRSAEGDVWIVLPGSEGKSPTKLYREGGGLVPKFYTLRTDGSKVYKDKGTVPKAERQALAEVDKEIKKISAGVEADRRAGKIIDPESEEALSRAGYVQRAQMEVEYKKIEAYNQARFVGLLNSLFDKKLGAWSNGVPSKICAKVFGLEYYKQDGWTRVPENSSAYQIQSELLKNIRTVMIEGEKEEVFEGIYRYAYTIRLLTNSTVQWETYLKNSCTDEISIEVFYDYGLLYQGQHFLYHYAGSQTQDMIFEQGIDPVYLFDTACVQFDDELEPYCVSLIHGNGFATPEQGKEYDCEYSDLEDHDVQGTDDLYVYE